MKKSGVIICMLIAGCLLCWGTACNKTDTAKQPTPVSFATPAGWPATKYDFLNNPLTEEGIQLGKKLFNDGMLSIDGNFPCGSCHQPFAAFANFDHPLSHGFNNQFTARNAPALFNLAWQTEMHHDGGITNLDLQPLAPITASNEMAETIPGVLKKLNADAAYREEFKFAFGAEEIKTADLTKALSQFMLTLVSASSKYDRVKQGKTVFNANEAAGYQVFIDKKCNTCHVEPLFTDNSYQTNDLPVDPAFNDIGRMAITGNPSDYGKFKVPSLRNIILTFPYMHDGRFGSLSAVYDHYNTKNPLSNAERGLLTEFFRSLTDSAFIQMNQP